MTITIRHIEDLKNTRTPLTAISGVGPKIDDKLRAGGIITIMALSACDPKRLVPLGLTEAQAKKAVKAAQDLVDDVSSGKSIQAVTVQPQEAEPNIETRIIVLNGREVEITQEDFTNAATVGMPVEDYMLLDEDTQARELRIARSTIIIDAPEIDHDAEEFDMGTMGAPSFIKARRREEIDAMQKAGQNRIKSQENTASFVKGIVHGEPVDGSAQNVNPVAKNFNPDPSKEELETEVYIPNRRQQENRVDAKKRQEKSVRSVIDNLL